jgi:phage regulator Rha-like protein
MPSKKLALPDQGIDNLIREIRDQKVILDSDLARVYGVPTFRFNEAIKRNKNRFPTDFMFQLDEAEFEALQASLTSQFAILKPGRGRHRKYRPYAFTEHGALQAANILRSARAVQMSVFVIRAFVKMRETLLGTRELARKLATLEKQLTGRLNSHEAAIVHVLQELMLILNPPPLPPPPAKPRIGFKP